MASGINQGIIAPSALIVPLRGEQLVSGALFISGANIFFMPYGGARPKTITSA